MKIKDLHNFSKNNRLNYEYGKPNIQKCRIL